MDEPLSRHSTFRIGGPADVFSIPAGAESMLAAFDFLSTEHIPYHITGGGSNTLFPDEGFRGVILKPPPTRPSMKYAPYSIDGDVMSISAGMSLQAVATAAAEAGLSGLETLAGIPGLIGGALCMNAGAFGSSISDNLISATVAAPGSGIMNIPRDNLFFGYRTSSFRNLDVKGAIMEASFRLIPSQRGTIVTRMKEIMSERRRKQPPWKPCAGSFFKNPLNAPPAGKLIDELCLKGHKTGSAMVSERHGNFIINTGGATSAEVLELADFVSAKVLDAFGVMLEPEVIVVQNSV